MPTVASGISCDPIEASLKASLVSSSYNSESLEDRIAASAKKVLLTKIEYVPADKESSDRLKALQTKYLYLKLNSAEAEVTSTCKESNRIDTSVNGSHEERSFSSDTSDGIPKPRVVIHPLDNVKLGWTRVYKIGAGLANLGNTCFLNATLQCLTYTPPLVNHLIEYKEHTPSCKNVGFCMMCELQRHIRRALDKNGEIIRPQCILQKLRSIAAHMVWGKQEDAHEFLRYVMESMVSASLNGFSNSKLDRISFETTVVNQIFGGYHRSQVICLRCKERSDTYDHFMDLMLDIKNVQSLEKAMENFVQPEVLDSENAYMCPNCKQKCPAKKRFTIHRAPNIATFQLKRFDYSRSLGGKITKHISFPEKFDMRSCMSQRQGLPIMYLLYAVLVHQGPSCNSGHYFCYVRNSNNLWYLMDDGKVRQVSLSAVLSQQAYLLFYSRIPHNGQLLKSPLQQTLPNSRCLHLATSSPLTNGVAGNPVNESFGVPVIRKPGLFPSNILKPNSGLTSTAMTSKASSAVVVSSTTPAASSSASCSSSTVSLNSLGAHREKIAFEFKTSVSSSNSNSSTCAASSSSSNSSNHQAQSSKLSSSSYDASCSSVSVAADSSQQKHPRIVMQIKNGKVYLDQDGDSPAAQRTILSSPTDTCNGPSPSHSPAAKLLSASRSGGGSSRLVPYASDTSEDSCDHDGTAGTADTRRQLPKGYESKADDAANQAADASATDAAKPRSDAEESSWKEDRLVNGKKNDAQLTVMTGLSSCSKVNATSQPWVVVDSNQQSPSVASESSNNSVNSTTGWTVSDQDKEAASAKSDRRYNRWIVVPGGSDGGGSGGGCSGGGGGGGGGSSVSSVGASAGTSSSSSSSPMVNGLKRHSSSGDKSKKSIGVEVQDIRKVQSKHQATELPTCSRSVVDTDVDSPTESTGTIVPGVHEEMPVSPAFRDGVMSRFQPGDKCVTDDFEYFGIKDCRASPLSGVGDQLPLFTLVNGHGSKTADDQATKRHKKRKRSKHDRDGDDSSSRKKAKHKSGSDATKTANDSASKQKRKRSSSGTGGCSLSGGDDEASTSGSKVGSNYELEWVEKTKETLQEKKDDTSRTQFVLKGSADGDCKLEAFFPREPQSPTLGLTNGDVGKHRATVGQSNGSSVVEELLRSSSRGYGSGVSSWEGERSNVDRDVDRDNQFKWFDRLVDTYDEEYDRGRTKKVKKPFDRFYRSPNGNPFQQAYDMKISGNYYQRQSFPWRPPMYQHSHWNDSRRGPRRGNHNFYHHNGNRARHSFYQKRY